MTPERRTTVAAMRVSNELQQALAESRALLRIQFPWWLRPFLMKGTLAITLGRRIYVGVGQQEPHFERLLRHEIEHVRQINKVGVIRFYVGYAIEYLHNIRAGMNAREAYRSISFEREAAAAEETIGWPDV